MTQKKNKLEKSLKLWQERDLTAEAKAGLLEPAYLCEDLLDEIEGLLRSGKHPVLFGESGVGKTATIYELVRRAVAGEGPDALLGVRVVQLSFRRCLAGLKRDKDIRVVFQSLVEALVETEEQIVPFFSDLEMMEHFNVQSLLQTLAYQTNRPILAEGSRGGIESLFQSSPELESQFVMLKFEEPDLDQTQEIVDQWRQCQMEQNDVHYTTGACEEALYLTHRFLARARMPRKVLDLLKQAGSLASAEDSVQADDIIQRFSRIHKVPRFLVDPKIPLDLKETKRHYTESVLGQPQAVEAVVRMVGMVKAGLTDARRPIGAYVFTGPTGVGKTYIAQMLSEHLFGSRDRMIRLNMADYQWEHSAFILFGNPDEYRPAQIRGVLTTRMQSQPFSVLLLDEFEKASPKVLDRFLQLIDEGCFINGAGELVSCRSTIIIATSNAGAELYRKDSLGFGGETHDLIDFDHETQRLLENNFRFEFLNRFDEIVYFHPLGKEDIRTIALRELQQLQDRIGMKRNDIGIEVDATLLDWLALNGYDPIYGARFLRRTIERQITPVVAEKLVGIVPVDCSGLRLSFENEKVVANFLHTQPISTDHQPLDEDNTITVARLTES